MTTPGDPSATGPDRPCGITALLPIGMSCRGRAEAFARSLQSRLRNLGSQGGTGDDEEDDGLTTTEQQQEQQHTENTWLSTNAAEQATVTSLQPLRIVASEADSFFDFGLDVESPNSPVEECEYTRLIETATATPTGVPSTSAVVNDPTIQAPESGYVCSTPCSTPRGSAGSSNSSSSDCQFYDPDSSDPEKGSVSGAEYYDCTIVPPSTSTSARPAVPAHGYRSVGTGRPHGSLLQTVASTAASRQPSNAITARAERSVHAPPAATSPNNPFSTPAGTGHSTVNGHIPGYTAASAVDSDSCSESLPPSQSTESNNSTFTGMSSNSNSTLQDVTMEPLEDQTTATGVDVPDSAYHVQQRMGNGHAIMPHGAVINADTEIELMSHPYGLKYEEYDETHGGSAMGATTSRGAVIQIEEVEKILKDCTMTEQQPETDGVRSHEANDLDHSAGNDNDDEDGRKSYRKSAMSSGDEDEEESKPQRIRRCSSLKTGKTPPGTPGRRKVVRFADVLGLDLTDVRTFMDEVPKVPQSAFEDLTIQAAEPPMPELSLGPKADRVLVPLFQQPGALPCFLDRVRDKQINLENAAVTDPITLTITGTVRVRNLDFHKSVYVRYTLDNWRSYADLQAVYAENSCDGFSDKFSFTLHGNSVQVGQRIEMAVRFHCRGEQFWDNNYDTNYVFQCLPITQPLPMISNRPVSIPSATLVSEASWGSSFY